MTSRRLLDETSVTLLKAAEYIEEHGWCQFTMNRLGEGGCIVGALQTVCSYYPLAAIDKVSKFIDLPSYWNDVSGRTKALHWNDAPGRTKEEVLAALRGAAMME